MGIESTARADVLPRAHAVAGLREVDAEEWDALVPPGRGGLRRAQLLAWQECELAALRSRPLVVRGRSGELLAAAPGYLYELDVVAVQESWVARLLQALRVVRPRLLTMRVLELGCAVPDSPPFLHAPWVDTVEAAERLLDGALREADAEQVDMLIVQDFPDDAPWRRAFRERGFSRIPMHPTIVVDVVWDSFDEYLAAMRANYRRRARTVLKRSAHLTPELVEDFSPLADELSRLWRCVFDRATEYRRELLPPAYFAAAAADDATRVLLLRRDDASIASFAVLYDDAPVLHFFSCGFEAAAGQEEGAYFRLLYEIVRVGIEEGYEEINLGMTTAEPKYDVGGRPLPVASWMRHRSRLLHRSFAALGAGPFAPEAPEPRHVFKD
ncbi:MAG TPA: GNAT family N-acetyltransferase [Gaiellaceae bacterium]|nr:GNAT family N-acetyltransferase [Gaiellaceae bacterium]